MYRTYGDFCEGWFFPSTHNKERDYIFVAPSVCTEWVSQQAKEWCRWCRFFAFYFIAHLFMYFIIVTGSKVGKHRTHSATPCSEETLFLLRFVAAAAAAVRSHLHKTETEYVIYTLTHKRTHRQRSRDWLDNVREAKRVYGMEWKTRSIWCGGVPVGSWCCHFIFVPVCVMLL